MDSVSGDDAAGNGGSSRPWHTITHAARQSTAGDSILIAAGEYDSSSGEVFPIEVPAGVAIFGAGRDETVVRADTSAVAIPWGTLEGISLIGVGSGSGISTSGVSVRHCRIENFAVGIDVATHVVGSSQRYFSVGSAIDSNWISDNDIAIATRLSLCDTEGPGYEESLIVNNVMVRNQRGITMSAICVDAPHENCAQNRARIWNNTIVHSELHAIDPQNDCLGYQARPSVVNNIIAFSGGYGVVDFDDGIDYCGYAERISANLFHENALGDWISGDNATPDNVFGDPLFVNTAADDYHLSPMSPAIDAGATDVSPQWDFEGDLRPLDGDHDQAAIIDIGADEHSDGSALVLRWSKFAAAAPPVPSLESAYPFQLSNPRTPIVIYDFESGDSSPRSFWPLALYQVSPPVSEVLLVVKVGDDLRFLLR